MYEKKRSLKHSDTIYRYLHVGEKCPNLKMKTSHFDGAIWDSFWNMHVNKYLSKGFLKIPQYLNIFKAVSVENNIL